MQQARKDIAVFVFKDQIRWKVGYEFFELDLKTLEGGVRCMYYTRGTGGNENDGFRRRDRTDTRR